MLAIVDWLKWKVIGGNDWMENLPGEKREKVRWKQNLYYLPSLEESGRGNRVRFNYLYFVIMHWVKRGFLSRKKKMASGPEFTFLWIILLTKKNPEKGKKTVFICKGSPQKRSCFDFFRTPHYSKMSSRSPDSQIRMKINIEWHNV